MGNSAQTSTWVNKRDLRAQTPDQTNTQSNKQCGKNMYTPSKLVSTHCVGV